MVTESFMQRCPRMFGRLRPPLKHGPLLLATLSVLAFSLHFGRFSSWNGLQYHAINPDLESLFENLTNTDPDELLYKTCDTWPQRRLESEAVILVPFRNREDHLRILINYFTHFFKVGDVPHILVVEQLGNQPFNRGQLFNIGYVESLKRLKLNCLIFHDVDLLPVVHVPYSCSSNPVHMSSSIDRFRYLLPYEEMTGGVLMMPANQFNLINGFSNSFHGWGGEDDDLYRRMREAGLHVERRPPSMSRYRSLYHPPQEPSPHRYNILAQFDVLKRSGLWTLDYDVVEYVENACYSHLSVQLS